MRKKRILLSGMALLLMMLCACGREQKNENTQYSVYYIMKDGTSIVEETCDFSAESTEEMIKGLLNELTTEPESVEYYKPIPDGIEVTNFYLEDNQLSLYFNDEYSTMDSMTEVLCRAAVVNTLLQIPEVQCVSFYVGGVPLKDNKGNLIGIMTADSFVENPGEQINSILTANVTLYFADQTGDGLLIENQEVHYSSNISMEKLVIERLLAGPLSKNAKQTIPSGTQLLSVSTVDGVCYVNFDDTFKNQDYEIQEPVVIYSIVDSLLELPNVLKVQISVNGDTNGVYRDKYTLSTLYERNVDFVVGMASDFDATESEEVEESSE